MCNVEFKPGIFGQQGWQCPICKRVYSPYTSMCYYCGQKDVGINEFNTIKCCNKSQINSEDSKESFAKVENALAENGLMQTVNAVERMKY